MFSNIIPLLPLILSASTLADQVTPPPQCVRQFVECVQNGGPSRDLFDYLPPTTRSTPTAFPFDKTPPTSPIPNYIDASSCGINGYMFNGSQALTIRPHEANQLLNAMRAEFPWSVLLTRRGDPSLRCAATVIDPRWLLTSAACPLLNGLSNVSAIFNAYIYTETTEQRPPRGVMKIEVPWTNFFFDSDKMVALIKLPTPMSLSANWTVQQLCLPRQLDMCRYGACQYHAQALVSGWEDPRPDFTILNGTIKKAIINIPSYDLPNPVLKRLDLGAPVSAVTLLPGSSRTQRFTMCGFHAGGGYFWPLCDSLAWIQSIMQRN